MKRSVSPTRRGTEASLFSTRPSHLSMSHRPSFALIRCICSENSSFGGAFHRDLRTHVNKEALATPTRNKSNEYRTRKKPIALIICTVSAIERDAR